MYQQVFNPVADSLAWSSPFAALPLLANGVKEFNWPVLDVTNPSGDAVDTVFTLNWLPAAGTLVLSPGCSPCWY